MSEILDSGERRTFETGAERDMQEGKGRFDLLPMCVLMRLAKHYEKGAIKYKERNWEKGIPAHSFADSAMRHLVKYLDGWKDEDHLIAAIWNLMGLAWTEEKKPEMMDIQARETTPTEHPDDIADREKKIAESGYADSPVDLPPIWIYQNDFFVSDGKGFMELLAKHGIKMDLNRERGKILFVEEKRGRNER